MGDSGDTSNGSAVRSPRLLCSGPRGHERGSPYDVSAALFAAPPDAIDGATVRPNVALSFMSGRGEVRQRALIETIRKLAIRN